MRARALGIHFEESEAREIGGELEPHAIGGRAIADCVLVPSHWVHAFEVGSGPLSLYGAARVNAEKIALRANRLRNTDRANTRRP